MENNQDIENEQYEQPTYDVLGLVIGALVGLVFSFFGIIDFLMGIILGMFVGLVAGTLVKKK
ncbi:MAG: hypothetical protein II816_03410 [Elusimicrobia bacterium]|nr:hypothetical protein [Elusimicrobiota bacterium]